MPSIHHISLSKDIKECTETNERQIVFGPFSHLSSSSSCSNDSFGKGKERSGTLSPFKTIDDVEYDDEFSGEFLMTFKEMMEWKRYYL